ncbi:MAG TPA: pseudouridine synthase [Planctomycetota bacterium]|jgi:23S rRNA pseudouridine2605 synthase|nr:pseudouridine synthase [Planctomycetota bacterium]
MSEMRLQKYLAMQGVASRRRCEELIVGGRVDVNGKPVLVLGTKIDPDRDTVAVDGERLRMTRRFYVALHKPKGVVCTAQDPAGRPRAIDLVADVPARLYPIGRLDADIEGLLLLTNDGDFAQRVAHPRFAVEKTYRITVKGEPDGDALEKLRQGVWLAEGKTTAARIHVLRKTREATTFTLTIPEGKNREVHRMLARVGLPVTRLLRDQIGAVRLGTLKRGEWRFLSENEVEALRRGPPAAPPHRAEPPRDRDRGPERRPDDHRGHPRGPDRGPQRGHGRGPQRGPDRGPPRGPGRGRDRRAPRQAGRARGRP